MDKIGFDTIGEMVVTLPVTAEVTAGMPVKLGTDGVAAPCQAGDHICGVALAPRGGFAAVQVGGFVTLPCADSTVTTGWTELVADGSGGVKTPGGSESGAEYLVAQVAGGMASLLL